MGMMHCRSNGNQTRAAVTYEAAVRLVTRGTDLPGAPDYHPSEKRASAEYLISLVRETT